MKVNIKELNQDSNDVGQVREFIFKMIKDEFGYDYVPKWHQDVMNLDEYYINPKRNALFVAYSENGEIIGTIGLRAYDKDFPQFRHLYSNETTSSIWRLFVDRRYRRCGLASKMFSVVESFAKDSGYKNIYLHTHKNLDGALRFWTKMGFAITLDQGDELETVHMEKYVRKMEISPQASILTYTIKI